MAGGGGAWFFFFRARLKREANALKEAEFNALSAVVERSSTQIAELSERVREMEAIRTQLVFQVEELKRENQTLKALIEQLKKDNHEQQIGAEMPNPKKAGRNTKRKG